MYMYMYVAHVHVDDKLFICSALPTTVLWYKCNPKMYMYYFPVAILVLSHPVMYHGTGLGLS